LELRAIDLGRSQRIVTKTGGDDGSEGDEDTDGREAPLPTLEETCGRLLTALALTNVANDAEERLRRAANVVAWITQGALRRTDIDAVSAYEVS
jgi:hypothetical protein